MLGKSELYHFSNFLPPIHRYIGKFLTLSPEYCFVAEDENVIVGYVLAALDSRKFEEQIEVAWVPEMCNKYPLPKDKMDRGEILNSAEEMISSIHQDHFKSLRFPDAVHKTHPSIVFMNVLPSVSDVSVPKKLLLIILAALKSNGNFRITIT